jgi:hypothetical protein
MPTPAHILSPLFHALLRVILHPQVYITAGAAVMAVTGAWLRKQWIRWKQSARERKTRNWPTLTATIEVPSVVEEYEAHSKLFVGTLTYFYRNPELQIGEYQRAFASKDEARNWASHFKNRTVLVHVNPCDPSDSVLPQRELAGANPSPLVRKKAATETFVAGEAVHALTPGMRLLCGVAELASLAGCATSAVLFVVSLARGARLQPVLYYWAGGALLALSLACVVALHVDLIRSDSGRQLLRNYRRWCPAWMRWSLTVTGVFFGLLHPLLSLFGSASAAYMHALAKRFGPHLPYLLGCWVFFVLTAFLTAILGSQEDPRLSIEAVEI